ncbi:MAG: NifU family protein [Alphaproteobacteria bacterium]|nr:NifU family protein [Alphaproteobacteria bacterium]OJV13864.1 MAG: NifU family protein [Alphaproteobacteria bacterium 33-17]
MLINVEDTPNPQTLKFNPGIEVTSSPMSFSSKQDAEKCNLAKEIFDIDGITSVYLGADFVTVSKKPEENWTILKTLIIATIMDFFTKGQQVTFNEANEITNNYSGEEGEIVKQIVEIIEEKVRPAVAQDGGDIVFRGYEDGVVKLALHGSCAGCPSSSVTLKNGIENMLKYYVPEVVAVEAVE